MNSHRVCPVRNSSKIVSVIAFQPQSLLRCSSCSLVFEKRIPTDDELTAHYAHYSYSSLKECPLATRESFRKVLDSFSSWQGKRRLLDLGCGQGDFIVEANAVHWHATGIEFSESAVSLCRERGLTIALGSSAAKVFDANNFDVITAFEVLEHLRDPADLLKDASRLLRSGGLLYLTTPNFDALLRHLERDCFEPICYPDHLCHFSATSLRNLAANYGFTVAKLHTTGLDPWRLKRCFSLSRFSKVTTAVASPSEAKARSEFREATLSSLSLVLTKSAVNAMVNAAKIGDTLKAWLVKA